MLEQDVSLISLILMFAASTVPLYLSFKLRGNLRKLTIVLFLFITIHGIYHIFVLLDSDFWSYGIFEPASSVIIVIFGLLFLKALKTRKIKV